MSLNLNEEFNPHGLNDGDGAFSLPNEVLESMGVKTGFTATYRDSYCVPEQEDAQGYTPETTFSYDIEINFATEEDYNAFLEHPDRDEIFNTMRQGFIDSEFGGIEETLRIEMNRDSDGHYSPEESGPDSFTPNTVLYLNILGEEVAPVLNGTYNINIESITFSPESNEFPGCSQGYDYGDPAQANLGGGVSLPKLGG